MFNTIIRISLSAGVLLSGIATFAAGEPSVTQSRELARTFGVRVQTALQQALTEGGPLEAIKVCKNEAPQIASEISRMSGAKVRRTSMKFRNPANAPEPWEVEQLQRFASTTSSPDEPLEYFTLQDDGTARYLLGIRTGAVCLNCHGTVLAPEVVGEIHRSYPHDRAQGYTLNELRGAFSITWSDTGKD